VYVYVVDNHKLGSTGIPLCWDGRHGWSQDARPSPHMSPCYFTR